MQSMADYDVESFGAPLRRIVGSKIAAAAIDRAAKNFTATTAKMQWTSLAEVPEFSRSRNPELAPELAQHGKDNVDQILRLLRGEAPGRFEFVHAYARRRAEQRFPLEATLHAYRSNLKVWSRWLCESVYAVAAREKGAQQDVANFSDFAIEYADTISTIFASTYSAHSILLADLAGDQRSELLQTLLGGYDEADPRAAQLLRESGFLEERQFFCVALARSVDPTEMLNASRARRMADSIEQIIAEHGVRRVIDLHNGKVTMVFAAVSRDSGWTAPRASLAKRMLGALSLVGNAALIGVSNDVPSTARIPTAYREAATALDLASVSQRVVQFSDVPMRQLLVHFAAKDIGRVLPPWAAAFRDADAKAGGALVETLRTYASVDMNILKSADLLGVHPNTIYARFQRVFDISGLQPRSFDGLNDLLIICDVADRDSGG